MTPTNRNSLISHTPTETKFIFPTMSGVEEVQKRLSWITCLKDFMCLFSFNQKIFCTTSRPSLGLQHTLLTVSYSVKSVNARVHLGIAADITK